MISAEKVDAYRLIKAQLMEIKAEEMEMRLDLCEEMGIETLAVGTHNLEFEDEGVLVKMVKKLNHTIDKGLLESMGDLLSEEEADCIAYDPRLKLTEYKKCEETDTLDLIIVTKSATPALDVILKDFG